MLILLSAKKENIENKIERSPFNLHQTIGAFYRHFYFHFWTYNLHFYTFTAPFSLHLHVDLEFNLKSESLTYISTLSTLIPQSWVAPSNTIWNNEMTKKTPTSLLSVICLNITRDRKWSNSIIYHPVPMPGNSIRCNPLVSKTSNIRLPHQKPAPLKMFWCSTALFINPTPSGPECFWVPPHWCLCCKW